MQTLTHQRRIACSILGVMALASVISTCTEYSHAQVVEDASSEQGIIRATADIFEMLALSDERDAQYVWILTKDGAFVEAGREMNFRTRFTEPGFYMLDGSVNSTEGELLYRKTFTIEVPGNFVAPEPSSQLLQSIPALRGSSISIPDATEVVTLIPSTDRVRSMKLDTDTETDTDGNGNPTDDSDAAMTLAAFDASPLHLWIATGEARDMQAEFFLMDGSTNIQLLSLVEEEEADAAIPTGASMQFEERRNGEVKFSLDNENITASSPVVLYWNFGDGFQSILTSPTHKYLRNGEYAVTVKAFDLRTGQPLVSDEGRIMVTSVQEISSGTAIGSTSSESSSEETAPVVEPTPAAGSSFPWQQILLLALLGIVAVIGGLFLVWVIRKILGGSGQLQKTLEEVEARIIEKKEKSDNVIDVAPPLQIKRNPKPSEAKEVTPEESPLPPEPTPEEPSPEPEPEPVLPEVNEEEAPAWLKKGLHTEAPAETTDASAAPVVDVPTTPEPPAPEEPTSNTSASTAEEPSVAPETPAPAPVESPIPPAPVVEEPEEVEEPVVPTPEPAPTPAESPAPSPVASAPVATPNAPAAPLTPEELARQERERERKRQKRQRYRENKKKREAESKESNVAPSTVASPSIPPAPESPNAVPTPVKPPVTEPAAPVPMPAPAAAEPAQQEMTAAPSEPTPVEATPPTPVTPEPPAPVVATAAESLPTPEPVTALPTNLEGLLPEPDTTNDNEVAFVIQADSLKKDEGASNTNNTTK